VFIDAASAVTPPTQAICISSAGVRKRNLPLTYGEKKNEKAKQQDNEQTRSHRPHRSCVGERFSQ